MAFTASVGFCQRFLLGDPLMHFFIGAQDARGHVVHHRGDGFRLEESSHRHAEGAFKDDPIDGIFQTVQEAVHFVENLFEATFAAHVHLLAV